MKKGLIIGVILGLAAGFAIFWVISAGGELRYKQGAGMRAPEPMNCETAYHIYRDTEDRYQGECLETAMETDECINLLSLLTERTKQMCDICRDNPGSHSAETAWCRVLRKVTEKR